VQLSDIETSREEATKEQSGMREGCGDNSEPAPTSWQLVTCGISTFSLCPQPLCSDRRLSIDRCSFPQPYSLSPPPSLLLPTSSALLAMLCTSPLFVASSCSSLLPSTRHLYDRMNRDRFLHHIFLPAFHRSLHVAPTACWEPALMTPFCPTLLPCAMYWNLLAAVGERCRNGRVGLCAGCLLWLCCSCPVCVVVLSVFCYLLL
jgi:hypothetical protein